MFNTIVGAGAVGAGAVGAGAASRYGSGSDKKMRLLAAPAPQHCLKKLILSDFAEFLYGQRNLSRIWHHGSGSGAWIIEKFFLCGPAKKKVQSWFSDIWEGWRRGAAASRK
jgi:hypothetical protein